MIAQILSDYAPVILFTGLFLGILAAYLLYEERMGK